MMRYVVKTFRDAGLQARWTKTREGAPMIAVRNPNSKYPHQSKSWWLVHQSMWDAMKERGIMQGFDECTALGNIFNIPA